MYSGVLSMHESAIAFCIDGPELIDSAYDEAVKWLTADYIGQRLYSLISVRHKKQWGFGEQRYGRGGQNRSATKSRYTAQQVECDGYDELANDLRSEGVSSEGRWNEICDTFYEEMRAAEQGHDTFYDEKGEAPSAQGANIWNTIMNVESKIAPEKRTFFRAREERLERPNGASYGSRGQPKPDLESAESMEYCNQINWSQMSEEGITEVMCAPCEEHPAIDGQDTHHLNFQCRSCFHKMRDCSRMLIKTSDKIRDWKELTNADSEIRKKARFVMQDKVQAAMNNQTWVPERVMREINQREEKMNQTRFTRR